MSGFAADMTVDAIGACTRLCSHVLLNTIGFGSGVVPKYMVSTPYSKIIGERVNTTLQFTLLTVTVGFRICVNAKYTPYITVTRQDLHSSKVHSSPGYSCIHTLFLALKHCWSRNNATFITRQTRERYSAIDGNVARCTRYCAFTIVREILTWFIYTLRRHFPAYRKRRRKLASRCISVVTYKGEAAYLV